MDIDDSALHMDRPISLGLAGPTREGGEVDGSRAKEFGGPHGRTFDDGQVQGRAYHLVVDLGFTRMGGWMGRSDGDGRRGNT